MNCSPITIHMNLPEQTRREQTWVSASLTAFSNSHLPPSSFYDRSRHILFFPPLQIEEILWLSFGQSTPRVIWTGIFSKIKREPYVKKDICFCSHTDPLLWSLWGHSVWNCSDHVTTRWRAWGWRSCFHAGGERWEVLGFWVISAIPQTMDWCLN